MTCIQSSGGGIKARKIQFIMQHVAQLEYDVIVTNGAPQSNHARATALEAARIGIRAHIVIVIDPEKEYLKTGNILLMQMSGAEIEYCRKEELASRMDAAINKYQRAGHNPFYLWGGGHHISGTKAFVDAAAELQEQAGDWNPDYLVIASGTGSTQAGLAIGFARSVTKVIGVSVARSAQAGSEVIRNCVKEYTKTFAFSPRPSIQLFDDWNCGGYEKLNSELLDLIRVTARLGVFLDPTYSGKGWLGLNRLVAEGTIPAGSKVVFWHSGGLMNLQAFECAPLELPVIK